MKVLLGKEAFQFLAKYVQVAEHVIVKDFEEAKEKAEKMKFPVVIKLISDKAIHKTEIGAIKIVHDAAELEKVFSDLEKLDKQEKLKADFVVQEFVEGKEVIIGIKNDVTFGHVIMLGIGGIFVELLHDVSFRACPISEEDAETMINDLHAKEFLLGYRGKKVNLKLLKEILVNISKMPEKTKNNGKIEELDINPLIINGKVAKAVDARVVFD